jgi:lysosomal acid lipase/cholesteryl ester hydrolase
LIDIAGTWFFNTPQKSAATILAKEGYDIWLGNNRGTTNSFKHVNLTVEDKAYWQYTFNEMGKYDAPAFQRTVLNKTGKDQLVYVGHSQGTTQFWIANTMDPEFGKHVKAMAGLAPVMYQGDISYSFAVSHSMNFFKNVIDSMFMELLWLKDGYNTLYTFIDAISPRALQFFPRTSWTLVQAIVGFDKVSHLDNKMMPMMGKNDVGGSSTKNLNHWLQNM